MENDNQVDVTTTTSDESTIETTVEETVETPVVPKSQYDQVFARAKKAEEALKKIKPTITKPEDSHTLSADDVWEVAEFIREGHSREEVEFIKKNGGREALKDPNSLVSVALKARKEQRQAEQAASMARDSGYGGEIIGNVTMDQLKNMSADEMAKHLPHAN